MNEQHKKVREHLHKLIKIYRNVNAKKRKNIILDIIKEDLKKEIMFFFTYRFCIDYFLEHTPTGWQYQL